MKAKSAQSAKERKQVARFLEAFETLSRREPEAFRRIAPELLRRGIWRTRGSDAWLECRLDTWLEREWDTYHFSEVLGKRNEILSGQFSDDGANPRRFKGAKKDWLLALEERFTTNWARWDTATRDQFIILGIISSSSTGALQGQLVDLLGFSDSPEDQKEGSNAVRAAKIALTRMALKSGVDEGVFSPAEGHGRMRLHSFVEEGFREPTSRWLQTHPASVLLPNKPQPARKTS